MADAMADFRCAATGKPLYMPVVTPHGVVYSYAALFDMFMSAGGALPVCKSTKEPIAFFPGVCLPIHHYLFREQPKIARGRKQQDEEFLLEKYGFQMSAITEESDYGGDEGLLDELQCAVSGALAFNPCVLSSGTIVSAYCVPEGGFRKDPNRLIGCAMHGQAPRKCEMLVGLLRTRFPDEYENRGEELLAKGEDVEGQFAVGTWEDFPVDSSMFLGLGCDGCGQWPIRGEAWEDADCPDKTGFHLCGQCYKFKYHKRVATGKFNQTHVPKHRMVQLPEADFM